MRDLITGLCGMIILALFFYGLYNGVASLVCLSSEGNPYWNKIVVACYFNDTSITTVQTTIIQDSYCYRNGVKVNCSQGILQVNLTDATYIIG